MKVLSNPSELEGKTIKYCTIGNGTDIDESMIITTLGEVMMLNTDYDDDTYYKTFNEKQIIDKMLLYGYIQKALINNGVITEEEFAAIKEKREEERRSREELVKQKRYEEYLKLKKEFDR